MRWEHAEPAPRPLCAVLARSAPRTGGGGCSTCRTRHRPGPDSTNGGARRGYAGPTSAAKGTAMDASAHRNGPPADARGPPPPHRPAVPRQARARRRRRPAHVRRARCRRRPHRRRARRRRAVEGRPARAAVPQLLGVRGPQLRHGTARRGPGADQLHARPGRDRVHPRPQRRHGVRRRGRARRHRAEGDRRRRRLADPHPRGDPAGRPRRPRAGPTSGSGSSTTAPRRRSRSTTRTRCGSCTPPAPSRGPRARCTRAGR